MAAIIGLARALGLQAVAEGVEQEIQVAKLVELGCELAQGFLFTRPMTAEAISGMLRGSITAPALRADSALGAIGVGLTGVERPDPHGVHC